MTVAEMIKALQCAEADLSKHKVKVWDMGQGDIVDCEISFENDEEGKEVVVIQPLDQPEEET